MGMEHRSKKYNLQFINFNCSFLKFDLFSVSCIFSYFTFFLRCSLSVTSQNITQLAAVNKVKCRIDNLKIRLFQKNCLGKVVLDGDIVMSFKKVS